VAFSQLYSSTGAPSPKALPRSPSWFKGDYFLGQGRGKRRKKKRRKHKKREKRKRREKEREKGRRGKRRKRERMRRGLVPLMQTPGSAPAESSSGSHNLVTAETNNIHCRSRLNEHQHQACLQQTTCLQNIVKSFLLQKLYQSLCKCFRQKAFI